MIENAQIGSSMRLWSAGPLYLMFCMFSSLYSFILVEWLNHAAL